MGKLTSGLRDVFLEQDGIVAKAFLAFSFRALELTRKVFSLVDDLHSFAAASRDGFDQHGVPDLVRFEDEEVGRLGIDRWI